MMQLSFIDTSFETEEDKLIRKTLKRGSGFQGGKERIKNMYQTLNRSERVQALRKEYGVGGSSRVNGFMEHHDASGISIEYKNHKINLTWNEVEKEIEKLVTNGLYEN